MAKKKPATRPRTTKPVVKRKAVAAKTAAFKPQRSTSDKKFRLQQQIQSLQKQVQDLDQGLVAELKTKLEDARKVVSILEAELATLSGRPASEPKAKRTRRPSITDEYLQPQVLAVMAKHGHEGMNARQLAKHLHQDAVRIRKFIADNSKLLKRTGQGAGTKFFLT